MFALAAASLILSIAVPTYRAIIERQTVRQAVNDLTLIASQIERLRTVTSRLPDSLSELSGIPVKDPWGNDYEYLNFASGVKGKIRKDHNLHPLNSEFDLYSVGADGTSVAPLTAKASRDDVIWARDGGFVGLASDY